MASSLTQGLSLAIDPTTPATVYAGTQTGLWKSFNGGDTWAQLNVISGGTSRVNEIAIDPTNTYIIYVATNRGLYKSSNGGLFWSVLNPSSGLATYNSIAIDPLNHLTLYAGSGIGFESILKSTDGGATWTSQQYWPDVSARRVNL